MPDDFRMTAPKRQKVDSGVHCEGSGKRGSRAICPNTHVFCGTCGRVLFCDDYADRVPDHTALTEVARG